MKALIMLVCIIWCTTWSLGQTPEEIKMFSRHWSPNEQGVMDTLVCDTCVGLWGFIPVDNGDDYGYNIDVYRGPRGGLYVWEWSQINGKEEKRYLKEYQRDWVIRPE